MTFAYVLPENWIIITESTISVARNLPFMPLG